MIRNNYFRRAFTLFELAIVLVIIGLLVGGIMVGQELIHQAAIRGTIKQLDQYVAALYTYRVEYNAIPGDHKTASNFFAGVANGNGDGVIRSPTSYVAGRCLSADPSGGSEVTEFWRHLAAARLINFTPNPGLNTFSDNYPEFPLTKGGYIIPTCFDSGDQSYYTRPGFITGNYFILNGYSLAGVTNTRLQYQVPGLSTSVAPYIKGADAGNLDCKMDDCSPSSGIVMAIAGCSYNQTDYSFDVGCDSSLMYRWGK